MSFPNRLRNGGRKAPRTNKPFGLDFERFSAQHSRKSLPQYKEFPMTIPPDAPFPAEFSILSKRLREAKTHQEYTSALDAMTEFLSKQSGTSSKARGMEKTHSPLPAPQRHELR